jgi:hypothetical protein
LLLFPRRDTKLISCFMLWLIYFLFRNGNDFCDFRKKKRKKTGDSIISYKHVSANRQSSNSRKTEREYEMFICTQIVTLLCWAGVFSAECRPHSSRYFILNLNTCENNKLETLRFLTKCLLRHIVFLLWTLRTNMNIKRFTPTRLDIIWPIRQVFFIILRHIQCVQRWQGIQFEVRVWFSRTIKLY